MKHLVIDGDSLAYRIPHAHRNMLAEQPEAIESEDDGLEDFAPGNWAKEAVQKELNYFLKLTHCTSYEIHLTAGRNSELFKAKYDRDPVPCFRYEISEDLPKKYKANRTADPIEGYHDVMRTLMEDFNAEMHDLWEADDAVVAIKNANPDNIRLCALDKDVLNQTVGQHYNYGKIELIDIDEQHAKYYKYYQAIIGDPGDGYGGVPGIGKAKVGNWINPKMSELELWKGVLKAYQSKMLGEKEALATMRLASMQQLALVSYIKEDMCTFELTLYEPPQ